MTRTKKIVAPILVAIVVICVATIFCTVHTAYAEETVNEEFDSKTIAIDGDQAVPYGWYTNLSFSIGGNNGEVFVVAKNKFTLFPAKVTVYLYLYSSTTYQDSCDNMVLVSQNYIEDLNMGESIEARASTNGEQKYWKGRIHYNIDGRGWKSEVTDTYLCNANGNAI